MSWEVPGTSSRYHPQPPSGGVPKSRWCRFQRRDAQCLIAENLGAAGAAMEMVSFGQNPQILKLAMKTFQKYSTIILLTLSHMAHGIVPESEISHTKVLNQSKVLFTAFFSFLLNGRTGLRHPAVCLKDL